jgi:RimJ/RimL family protein N-acetyltransferase
MTTTTAISFRRLLPEDSSAYREARLECLRTFPDNFGSTWEEENKLATLKFEHVIRDTRSDSFMMGAFDGDRLIGLCGFNRGDRKKTRHRGEIIHMYVRKEYGNRQIGTSLLRSTIEAAFENPEIEQISLSVVHQNEQANKVYDRVGFVEYGRIPHYFKSGERYWDQRFMIIYREGFRP